MFPEPSDKICFLPYSHDWIILPVNVPFNRISFNLTFTNGHHNLYTTIGEVSRDYKSFVFGQVQRNSSKVFNGYYTKIDCYDSSITVSNDSLGISKFFYIKGVDGIASSRLKYLLEYNEKGLDRASIILNLLFNYNVLGRTNFKDTFYSEPGTGIYLSARGLHKKGLSDKTTSQESDAHASIRLEALSDFWVKNIRLSLKGEKRIGLTLTGGYDSRLVLGGLKRNGVKPNTFTFGTIGNADAAAASEVALRLGLNHKSIPFTYPSVSQTETLLRELLLESDSLINPFRIIRLKAIEEMSLDVDMIFLGYGGSEILRGIFPDGLLVSDFYTSLIQDDQPLYESAILRLKNHFFYFEESEIKKALRLINENRGKFGQFEYMVNVIIPMHFGEDIRYLMRKGIRCYSPFIDEGFIKKAIELGMVPLRMENESRKFKDSRLKRINNPHISARFMRLIDKDLSGINLNRGYSPNDYLLSKYYAGIKLVYRKILGVKRPPVTIMGPWLRGFFRNEPTKVAGIILDNQKYRELLPVVDPQTEYAFLPWTKAWSIKETITLFKERS